MIRNYERDYSVFVVMVVKDIEIKEKKWLRHQDSNLGPND